LRPLAIRGAKAPDHEALNTGTQILTDVRNKQPQTTVNDIFADRLTESAQRLVNKFKGGSRKLKRVTSNTPSKKKKTLPKKRREIIKGDIFS
jgi:hypothetical protein